MQETEKKINYTWTQNFWKASIGVMKRDLNNTFKH